MVHINAGVAGLVCAIVLGKRVGYGKDLMAPHNLTFVLTGAGLLLFGWYGFNAGSNLEANGLTALVILNTTIAAAAAALAWIARRVDRSAAIPACWVPPPDWSPVSSPSPRPAAGSDPAARSSSALIAGFVCLWARGLPQEQAGL